MNVRKSFWVTPLIVAIVWAACPDTSNAQFFSGRGYAGGGRVYNYGYYGYGYPAYYGTGSPYSSYGYGYNGNYYYNNSASMVSTLPANGESSSSYQASYPPTVASTDACGGGTASAGVQQGRGTVVVNLPSNAELYWNGSRSLTLRNLSGVLRLQRHYAVAGIVAAEHFG